MPEGLSATEVDRSHGGAQREPALRLLVLHDDGEREFAYTSGAEKALSEAHTHSWTVVNMKDDFKTVFAPHTSGNPVRRRAP